MNHKDEADKDDEEDIYSEILAELIGSVGRVMQRRQKAKHHAAMAMAKEHPMSEKVRMEDEREEEDAESLFPLLEQVLSMKA